MDKLLSVIIPVYNCEKYVERCIRSVLAQTYENIEVIVVDDGSKDNSLSICLSLAKDNNKVKVIHKENGGVVSARNAGIQESRGDFITFVDSDDWIEPDTYESMLNMINGENRCICALTEHVVRIPHVQATGKLDAKTALSRLCLMEFPTSMWAYIYPAELVKEINLSTDIHFFEDFLFNYLILQKVDCVYACDRQLYHYETNEGSVNRQGLSLKRLSCLKIADMINENGPQHLSFLENAETVAIAHFLICNIAVLTVQSDIKLKKVLKDACKKYKTAVNRSNVVPRAYKVAINMASQSISLAALVGSLRKKVKAKC